MKIFSKNVRALMASVGVLRALLIAGLLVGMSSEMRGMKKQQDSSLTSAQDSSLTSKGPGTGQNNPVEFPSSVTRTTEIESFDSEPREVSSSGILGGPGSSSTAEAARPSIQQTLPSQDNQKERATTQYLKDGEIERVKKQYPKTYSAIKGVYDVGATVAGAPRKAASYVGTKVGDMWTGSVKRSKEAYSWLGGKLGVRNREKESEDIKSFNKELTKQEDVDAIAYKDAVDYLNYLKKEEFDLPSGQKGFDDRLQKLLAETAASGDVRNFEQKVKDFEVQEKDREKGLMARMKEKLPSMSAFSLPKRKPNPSTQLSRDIKEQEENLSVAEKELQGIDNEIKLLEDRKVGLYLAVQRELNNIEKAPDILEKSIKSLRKRSDMTNDEKSAVIKELSDNSFIASQLSDANYYFRNTDEIESSVLLGYLEQIKKEFQRESEDLKKITLEKVGSAAERFDNYIAENKNKKEVKSSEIEEIKKQLNQMKNERVAQESGKRFIARLTRTGSKAQESFMTRVTGKTLEMRKLESQIKDNDKMIRQAQKEYDLAKENLRQDALDAGNAVLVIEALSEIEKKPANLNAVLSRLEANGYNREKIENDPEYRSVVIQNHKVMAEKFPLILKELNEKEQAVKDLREKGARLREERSPSVEQPGTDEKQGEAAEAERVTIEEGDDGWGVDRESQEIAREIEDQENNIKKSKQDREKGIVQQQKLANEFKQKMGEKLIKKMVDKLSGYEDGSFGNSDVDDIDRNEMKNLAGEYNIKLPEEFSITGYKEAFVKGIRNLQKMD